MTKLISRKYSLEYAGQTIEFPVIGKATFNTDGSLDVADEKVKDFIVATEPSFDFRPKAAKPDRKDKEVPKNKELKESLAQLDFKALVEFAKESGIDAGELMGLSDSQLRKKILKKLTTPE